MKGGGLQTYLHAALFLPRRKGSDTAVGWCFAKLRCWNAAGQDVAARIVRICPGLRIGGCE